jgi:hypothetical protein
MSDEQPPPAESPQAAALARLEERLARIEKVLALPPLESAAPPAEAIAVPAPPAAEDLEYVVGQNWFAGVGVVVLTCGVGFALSLPLPQLPAWAPSLIGYLLTGGLFFAARAGHKTFELVARGLRGAAMALLYLSTLRLFFFGATPVLDIAFGPSRMVLLAAVGLNLVVAWRQPSTSLVILALLTGYLTAAVVNSPWWLFPGLTVLSIVVVATARQRSVPALLFLGIFCGYGAHLLWVMGNPWPGHPVQLATAPAASVIFLLVYAVILGVAPLWRRDEPGEDQLGILTAIFNCAAGYGLFLAHTFLAFPQEFVPAHLLAALTFLGLAVAFWRRGGSSVSVFFYAMTGYLALTAAILKAFSPPQVFLWLSLQSLLVVATALWFRSRFIVVANFLIFVLVVLGYMFTAEHETGISLVFGLVALLTARILNWKRERLELQTDVMRNAYLVCAFVVFPYALYHLVPRTFVSVAWVGVAVGYYAMNLMVRNLKYRWMGHLTLLLTVLYVVIVGLTQLAPAYRIVSFLVLGTVLLVVSLVFTQVRKRRRAGTALGTERQIR